MEIDQQINCVFDDVSSLYSAYMPFVTGGGLFIRTDRGYPLGTFLTLSLSLMGEHEPYLLEGKVVWMTPAGAQRNQTLGVGLQFSSMNGSYLSDLIEPYFAGMNKSTELIQNSIYF